MPKKSKSKLLGLTRESFLAFTAALLCRLLFKTLRLEVIDHAEFLNNPPPEPLIMTFWHNRIPAIALGFLRTYHKNRKGVIVLTSPSKDGDILSGVMKHLGMGSVRGSSSRRGSTALRELSAKLEKGYDLAITPDGPRGPKYSLGPGVIFLAQKTGLRIMPLHACYHRAFRFKTWDAFAIPWPFSKITITIDSYVLIDATLTDLEPERLRLEIILKTNAQHADLT
ncbi:MAG: lysophospholipid acyltransferase family protein [Chthoniobacterales bacterium]|nr:lysophospholipid acyltransferase family protein [Chthoniobacterales bacterium]